jgi:hypothetical protein
MHASKSPDLCWACTARLKSGPDTKQQSGDSAKLAHSEDLNLASSGHVLGEIVPDFGKLLL